MNTLLIMAGGTGGHVFPALAVAQELRERGVNVVWLGTRRGLEARVVPDAGFDIEWISIQGLRGRGLLGWLLLPVRLIVAMWQAFRIIQSRRPKAVLSMGGFVAGPGGLVARIMGKRLIIHEANAIPGFTNRLLALIAQYVLTGFPETFTIPGTRHVGNPVRREILMLPPPEERYASRGGRCRVLIVGGSQGAQIFNSVLPEAVGRLSVEGRPEIWHQTGQAQQEETLQRYGALGIHDTRVTAFIKDMALAYGWADVVICRAGAMTVAELAAAGVASILVPFPFATDDHQSANARFLADRGGALFVPQVDFTPAHVCELLKGMAAARGALLRMAREARTCAMPDSTQIVASVCAEAVNA